MRAVDGGVPSLGFPGTRFHKSPDLRIWRFTYLQFFFLIPFAFTGFFPMEGGPYVFCKYKFYNNTVVCRKDAYAVPECAKRGQQTLLGAPSLTAISAHPFFGSAAPHDNPPRTMAPRVTINIF
jgi:hypothetical protein